MNKFSLRGLLLAGGAFAAAGFANDAYAAEAAAHATSATALEEIVVTARRREENLQTTPVAITAVSAEMMEARNVVTLAKISQIAPSFTLFSPTGGIGAAITYMRGIGHTDTAIGQDSPIGFYLDGVATGRLGAVAMDLVDPQRVEVLRGPQGTLFGRNTTGGAILITSHMPSDQFSGAAKASYGSYRAMSFQGRIDTGLLGNSGMKFSAAYQHRQQDGSHDSGLQPDNLDPGAQKSDAYFLKGVGDWGKLTATFTADYDEVTGVPTAAQIVNGTANLRNIEALSPTYGGGSYVITSTPLYSIPNDATGGEQRVWSEGTALTLEYKLNDNFTLKSISALRAYKRKDQASYGLADLRANAGTVAAPRIVSFNGNYSLAFRFQSQRQRSEELQLLGNLGDFDFVAGAYYFDEDAWDAARTRLALPLTATTVLDSVTDRHYTVTSKSTAGFAQANWRPSALDKKLEISAGVRLTKDTRDFVQDVALVRSAKLDSTNTSYLLSGNYQWTPDIMTYARFTTGYRAGGFNVRSVPPVNPIYQPERIKSWEVGFKMEGWDHRLRLNGAAFYNDYQNLQVSQFAPPGAGSAGGNVTANAVATYKGFELEGEAVPVDGLTLSASVGYVEPEYKSYPRALDSGAVAAGCKPIANTAGATVGQDCAAIASFIYFPKTTAALGVSYVLPKTSYGEWSFRADYAYKSSSAGEPFALPATPFSSSIFSKAYGLLSAKVALSEIPLSGGAKARIAVYGENLTNQTYLYNGIDYGFMATVLFGDRRTFGIEAKVDF